MTSLYMVLGIHFLKNEEWIAYIWKLENIKNK